MPQRDTAVSADRNQPGAGRMAVIAFINANLTYACIFGTFSVLLAPVQARLLVGPELSTLGLPAAMLSLAICAPVAGALAARFSLRLIMLLGSLLSIAGFFLLAVSDNFRIYLIAYGLLIGPGAAIALVLSGSLVTRWFTVNRGKALGFVAMPLVITVMPLVTVWMLQKHGLPQTYFLLAGMAAASFLANLFIIDKPPAYDPDAEEPDAALGMSMKQLISAPRFWALLVAYFASSTGAIILGTHLMPMARSWGWTPEMGASLLTICSLMGIAGTLFYGWVVDRLGGAVSISLLVLIPAVLWALLLLHPPFIVTAALIGLSGLNAAGAVPVLSYALSETFGRESFGRAYGLANLFGLPFAVLGVPATAVVYTHTGSYSAVIAIEALFMGITGLVALAARLPRAPIAAAA